MDRDLEDHELWQTPSPPSVPPPPVSNEATPSSVASRYQPTHRHDTFNTFSDRDYEPVHYDPHDRYRVVSTPDHHHRYGNVSSSPGYHHHYGNVSSSSDHHDVNHPYPYHRHTKKRNREEVEDTDAYSSRSDQKQHHQQQQRREYYLYHHHQHHHHHYDSGSYEHSRQQESSSGRSPGGHDSNRARTMRMRKEGDYYMTDHHGSTRQEEVFRANRGEKKRENVHPENSERKNDRYDSGSDQFYDKHRGEGEDEYDYGFYSGDRVRRREEPDLKARKHEYHHDLATASHNRRQWMEGVGSFEEEDENVWNRSKSQSIFRESSSRHDSSISLGVSFGNTHHHDGGGMSSIKDGGVASFDEYGGREGYPRHRHHSEEHQYDDYTHERDRGEYVPVVTPHRRVFSNREKERSYDEYHTSYSSSQSVSLEQSESYQHQHTTTIIDVAPVPENNDVPVCLSQSDINPYDVICGRGGGTNTQIGNQRFRQLVRDFQPRYLQAKRKYKPKLAQEIVRIIRQQGGRFLRKSEKDGGFYEVGDVKAEGKTGQALREGLDVRATMKRIKQKKESPLSSSSGASSHRKKYEKSWERSSTIVQQPPPHRQNILPATEHERTTYGDFCPPSIKQTNVSHNNHKDKKKRYQKP